MTDSAGTAPDQQGTIMRRHSILILGGTRDGQAMATALADHALFAPVSSLAGRLSCPHRPPGEVRIGGFGGFMGLAHYLADAEIAAVIDATHPFSAQMGWNAATACAIAGRPLLRLERPPWRPGPGDRWIWVDSWDAAAAEVTKIGARRVLLALGRRDLAPFAAVPDTWFLIRSVEPPDPMPPFAEAEVLTRRGPFSVAEETALLRAHEINAIVCRDSGGSGETKLTAARTLGLPVILHRRPPRPRVPRVTAVEKALSWLMERL